MKNILISSVSLLLSLSVADAEEYKFIVSDKSVNLSHSLASEGTSLSSGMTGFPGAASTPVETRIWTSLFSSGENLRTDKFSGYFLIVR